MLIICIFLCCLVLFFFFKQKTAYEMRISDWSSDVCSSDLLVIGAEQEHFGELAKSGPVEEHRLAAGGLGDDRGAKRVDQTCLEALGPRFAARTPAPQHQRQALAQQIGRASRRERVCQYVSISVAAVYLKKKKNNKRT